MYVIIEPSFKNPIMFMLMLILSFYEQSTYTIGPCLVFGFFTITNYLGNSRIIVDEEFITFSNMKIKLDRVEEVHFKRNIFMVLTIVVKGKSIKVGDPWTYSFANIKKIKEIIKARALIHEKEQL